MRRVSLGAGYRYLMDSVAVGDGADRRPETLAGYYAATGTPPGRFLGSGLAGLGDGEGIEEGSAVTGEHLFLMLGMCSDPLNSEPVGRVPNTGSDLAAVAGFDLTFSPSKSVSVLWALSDPATRQAIYDCHRQAIDIVLGYAEEYVFASRSGANGIVSEPIDGVVAAAFTHFDSRAGDPQLHDHVIIWNRARSTSDGKWRTLDSRAVFQSRSALSSMHQGVLADLLTQRLGVGWEPRAARHSQRDRWEIAGIPEPLLRSFSTRSGQIDTAKDDLIERFVADHGRQPTALEVVRLRQTATLATRPAKAHRSLYEMTDTWQQQAAPHGTEWITAVADHDEVRVLQAGDVTEGMLDDAATAVLIALGDKRATYRRDNLVDEAQRILAGVRFATPADRITVGERIADLAIAKSLDLTPASVVHTPQRYLRADGTSRLRARHLYTTPAILDAEARLLDAAATTGAPIVTKGAVARITSSNVPGNGHRPSVDQALAVERIATSGRRVDVLVGPAGTGKSTTMATLRAVWETDHGPGSVLGLAPSAVAAEVLAGDLGIGTDNTAKWLTEHRLLAERLAARTRLADSEARPEILRALDEQIDRWRLRPRQLVIVDEASMAGTLTLDELIIAAGEAGAKVVLVGDWAQVSAVAAGGAFGLLARQPEASVSELGEVRRFTAAWERTASTQLRTGEPAAVSAYEANERITEGTREQLLEAIYVAWKQDTAAGQTSLMIAGDTATVGELNRRARADRVTAGDVSALGVTAGEQAIGVGDWIVTRRNDRRLGERAAWVKNGDRWTVEATHPDGSLAVRRHGRSLSLVLPAGYVAEHVELGYATTTYRAQGRTVDTAHALINEATSRETLYVSATRGRISNQLYVDTSYDPDPQTSHGQPENHGARQVLASVLANVGAELSAHETLRHSGDDAESWAVLAAEYQTIATSAQAGRWNDLLARCGLSTGQLEAAHSSDALGPLHTALRSAEAHHLDVEANLPLLIAARSFDQDTDIVAALHYRVHRWTDASSSQRSRKPELISGLIPRAQHVADEDVARALQERETALQARATVLARHSVDTHAPWLRSFGRPPNEPEARTRWLQAVATVAAYRERWDLTDDHDPLDARTEPRDAEQARQMGIAAEAIRTAARLARTDRQPQMTPEQIGAEPTSTGRHRGIDL
jgi:conjugative relaxase-like TrwC/TraI family protein